MESTSDGGGMLEGDKDIPGMAEGGGIWFPIEGGGMLGGPEGGLPPPELLEFPPPRLWGKDGLSSSLS